MIVVDVSLRHAILACDAQRLRAIARNQRGDLRVLTLRGRWQDLIERQATDSDDRITDAVVGRQVGVRCLFLLLSVRILNQRELDLIGVGARRTGSPRVVSRSGGERDRDARASA
ncbi:hypothetical protein BSFA1_77630 (plasmid) [Burkholderia sp. SFA1]|nr:hypothetical protein BG58_29295 [Caballeronia jiangsuensis]BBQ02635.1 hypothetical protein BSFA1_77630 [Burkholderia sp. SFA1]